MNETKNQAKQLPYRKCVGIVVFNQDRKVWLGHRSRLFNTESKSPNLSEVSKQSDRLWQFPQGGIDEGEKPIEAAYRELYEETGMKNVKKLGKIDDWLQYDLPKELVGIALKGKYRGQKQKWFAMQFLGDESEISINPPPDNNPVEFDAWKWEDLDAVFDQVVPFKQQVYRKLLQEFQRFK